MEAIGLGSQGKAPVAADGHWLSVCDILYGVHQGGPGLCPVGILHTLDLYPGISFFGAWVLAQYLDVSFQTSDKALCSPDLFREMFEQIILKPVLLTLVVSLHDLEPGYVHIQVHALFDAWVAGTEGFDLCK